MDCGHEQMSIQDFHMKINGFKSTYSVAYFSINCLSLIKYKVGAIVLVLIIIMNETVNYV